MRFDWTIFSIVFVNLLISPVALANKAANYIQEHAPIELEAQSTEMDHIKGTMVFIQAVVTQGPLKLKADRIQATKKADGSMAWVLNGNVSASNPTMRIKAENGLFHTEDDTISHIEFNGNPVTVDNKELHLKIAHLRAKHMEYDLKKSILVAEEEAWFSDNVTEFEAPQLLYEITKGVITAGAGPKGNPKNMPVKIRFPDPRKK